MSFGGKINKIVGEGGPVPLFNTPTLRGLYVQRVLKSKWLTEGPMCEILKIRLGAQFGYPMEQIELANSASAGLTAVFDVLYEQGKRTVFVREDTWQGIGPLLYNSRFSRCSRESMNYPPDVILATDIGGVEAAPHEDPALTLWKAELERGRRPVLVLDAAHSWAVEQGERAPDFAVASFYPTKIMPGGEGGAVFCKTAEQAARVSLYLHWGCVPVHKRRGLTPQLEVYGRKGHMSDWQAALNYEVLLAFSLYHRKIGKAWGFLAAQATRLGIKYKPIKSRHYLFQAACEMGRIEQVRAKLASRGIQTSWNFPPAPWISLPCWSGMTSRTARHVIETYHECYKEVCHG